jgi:hypothetical protein
MNLPIGVIQIGGTLLADYIDHLPYVTFGDNIAKPGSPRVSESKKYRIVIEYLVFFDWTFITIFT